MKGVHSTGAAMEQPLLDSYDLGQLYDLALKETKELDSTWTEKSYKRAIGLWEECQRRTQCLGLFSPNESLEDLQTGSIRYSVSITCPSNQHPYPQDI